MTNSVLIVQLEILQINIPQFIRPICPNQPIIWDKHSLNVHDHDEDKSKDSEHKQDNHDETSEFLDNSDTTESEDDITTTISPEKETTTDLGQDHVILTGH